jgi:hypothetical protein
MSPGRNPSGPAKGAPAGGLQAVGDGSKRVRIALTRPGGHETVLAPPERPGRSGY